MTFSNDQGRAYYFPTLARFAVAPQIWLNSDPYALLLANMLSPNGRENSFFKYCDKEQRGAASQLLEWISANEDKIDCVPLTSRDFQGGWNSWMHGADIWAGRSDRG